MAASRRNSFPCLRPLLWLVAGSWSTFTCSASRPKTFDGLSSNMVLQVQDNLASVANMSESWVIGTQLEALLELHYPKFSVFADKAADYSKHTSDEFSELQDIVFDVIDGLAPGQMQLVTDKSAGDPCALLPAVTLFGALKDGTKEQRTAVQNQIDDLMTVPRVAHGDGTGAISHRTNETQIWADFVSMVPPALAFYGVVNDNTTMIDMSIQQCLFYRDILATDKGWRHILLGKWQDTGLWATGNAWAAWGILRVYATIKQSHHAADYKDELEELSGIVADILNVSWSHRHRMTGLLPNYFTGLQDNSTSSMFSEASSTSLMAATTYRYAQLGLGDGNVGYAEDARRALQQSISPEGWLPNVVDPNGWETIVQVSPEAQAFVLLLQSSWQDWKGKVHAKVQNDKSRRRWAIVAREPF